MNTKFAQKFVTTLVLFAFVIVANAQKGVPFISNFQLPSTMSNQTWSIIQCEDDNLIYALNRKGIYSFDGFEWTKLNVAAKPIAIYSAKDLFVGTDAEIGYFKKDSKGDYNYYSVQDSTLDIYYKFVNIDSIIYAVGTQHISKLLMGDKVKTEPVYIETDSTSMITDFFELNGIIYIIKNNNSLYRLDDKTANKQTFNLDKGETIKFTFNHNNVTYIGTSLNKLFLFNGWQFKPLALKDKAYLSASYMNGGISIDSNRFAISTLIGGCAIINSATLETEATINYSIGLPDDEVQSLGVDKSKGLWIAHGMGISRVDLNIPVRSFQHYNGISGNILSIAEFNRVLYVGGSEGLFNLIEVRNLKTIETPISQPKQTVSNASNVASTEKSVDDNKTQPETKDTKKKKKGFFSRLFSKSEKAEAQVVEVPVVSGETSKKDKNEKSAVSKKISTLQTISNEYQRIQGVDGKCKQLVIFKNRLLAATSTGLYEISGGKGVPVVNQSYIIFVKQSEFNPKSLFVCSTDGILELSLVGEQWKTKRLYTFDDEYPISLVELSENNLLVTTEFNVYNVTIVQGGESTLKKLTPAKTTLESPVTVKIAGAIKIFTTTKAYSYNQQKDELKEETPESVGNVISTIYSQGNFSWVNSARKWNLYTPEKQLSPEVVDYLGLFDRVNDIFINSNNDIYLVNDYSQIVKIKASGVESSDIKLPFYLKQVTDGRGTKLDINNIKLSYSNNSIKVRLIAPSYVRERAAEYQYLVEGLSSNWSEWTDNPNIELPFIPNGKYKLKIKARDVLGNESEIYTLPFKINPPFWKNPWVVIPFIILLIFLFFQFMKYRERQLQKEKEVLEEKVKERTKTIEEQKEVLKAQRDELAQSNQEILQQKEEIEAQRDEIEAQNDYITKQNQEMTQSIEYARRIQTAVMPNKEKVNSILPEHFILFKPRDIVSGDFYWMSKRDGKIIVAAADCTGHGVPGAFMSMLGISFLNEIVNVKNETKPDVILNNLRDSIKSTLSQTGKEGESKDGMDIALCAIDMQAKTIEFAGAYNPLYLIRNGELIEIKADKMPVGIHLTEKDSFTLNTIEFKKDDCIYIFSDGYVSQFGGEYDRKYMAKPFKKMLSIIADKPMDKQFEIIDKEFEDWRGYHPQVDDILVIGVKFE